MPDTKKCDMCGQMKRNVSLEPSRRQLLFGGFRVTYENRCPSCERKVAEWALKAISNA